MRTASVLLFSLLLAGGCASASLHRDADIVAVKIGLPEPEVVALAQQASVRHRRPIAWIKVAAKPEGAFEVWLADQPGSPHGIMVVFRLIDGRWQEDPALAGSWIA